MSMKKFIVNTDWKILKNVRFLSDNCWQTSKLFIDMGLITHIHVYLTWSEEPTRTF